MGIECNQLFSIIKIIKPNKNEIIKPNKNEIIKPNKNEIIKPNKNEIIIIIIIIKQNKKPFLTKPISNDSKTNIPLISGYA